MINRMRRLLLVASLASGSAQLPGDDGPCGTADGVPVVAVSYGYNHGQPIAAENPDLLVDSLDALI
mgnify:CR=1 FL=1